MTKTPFELRMELLTLAQGHLTGRFHSEFEVARRNADIGNGSDAPTVLTEVPKYPTTEDILAEAAKLKAFVDGN